MIERTVFAGGHTRRDGRTRTAATDTNALSLTQLGDPLHVGWADDPEWGQTSGDIVTWPNRGSVGGDLETSAPTRPAMTANVTSLGGRRAALFATGDVVGKDFADIAQPYTVVLVFARDDTANSARSLFSRDFISTTFDCGASNTYTLNAGSAVTGGAANVTTGRIAVLTLDGASSGFVVSPDISGSGNAGAGALSYFSLGGHLIAQTFRGYVAFWGIYAGATDVSGLYARLATYYNIS